MASATVAAWGSGSSTIDINVSGLRPGDKKTYIFEVTNTENGVTSEVGQDYSIIVETTGNLPLDFALTYDNSNPDHQGLFVNTGENGTLPSMAGWRLSGAAVCPIQFPPFIHILWLFHGRRTRRGLNIRMRLIW